MAIGTNLPFEGRADGALVDAALERLAVEGLKVLLVSTYRVTEAWPDPADPPFTNAVALLHAGGRSAQGVLDTLLRVERAFGRRRGAPNAPRTLDLDLLDLDGIIVNATGLVLPHPGIARRRFVLEPLGEICPGWIHPVLRLSAADLLGRLSGAV
ncbi:MAG: 2-amino-4-hydroxy-6-hydroxymethyldihydropteridine diphosphokinase [Hyphomonadaceae bacterium]|nr:MAG: 2-amino-4-hydroxy-6-hydroxymethyldihydropteridine diphosphokinase [Caulobacteraceae bacterium]MBT9447503.1 2-amino-4-hydroxy-6-hydroxymethyldihydropteridine diphosphokinase [Hyphomonadaceae bacterium]TPW07913.1 MAG: 2-amino-4-hydroxy-6-hydroxymethyldihydropteridine diphosphokinase [Alphaproteobacteria bacterium]